MVVKITEVKIMYPLPGKTVSVEDDEWGKFCYMEGHHERPAVRRLCVEADSFGAEFHNMCQECWDEHLQNKEDIKNDPEQWETCKCGNREPSLISYRDMDEGMHGPVYEHCSKCHEKMNARIAEEEAYYDDHDDYDDYTPDDAYDSICDEPIPQDLSLAGLEKFNQILISYGIKGFKAVDDESSRLSIGDLEPRKFKRLKRKLLHWFARYTDAYTRPQEGFVGCTISDKLEIESNKLYVQFTTEKVSRYSLAKKPPMAFLKLIDRKKAKSQITYGPFIKPKHSIFIYLSIYE